MGLFKKSTIFHVEESLPDPEELKLRFRRRVLIASLLGFLLILGAPVVRELQPNLQARAEARRFAEQILVARTLAAISRLPVSLQIAPDRQGWRRAFHASGESCGGELPGPERQIITEGIWKIQAQQENGIAVISQTLCFHPIKGVLLNSEPVGEGKILVSLISPPQESGPEHSLASVLITQGGGEVQTISY